jgi:hypothetical protein
MPITLLNNNNNMQSRYAGIFSFNANKWWLPIGILPSNVIAAYQFKGVASEANALLNVNNPATYPLTKVGSTVTWNQSTGFYIPATNRYGLNNASITSFTSVFIRYSDLDISANTAAMLIAPAAGYRLWSKLAVYASGATYFRKNPGFTINDATGGNSGYIGTAYNNAILGWIRNATLESNILYINGSSVSFSNQSHTHASGATTLLLGQSYLSNVVTSLSSYTVQAVAFYNTVLTAAQALELSDAMAAL